MYFVVFQDQEYLVEMTEGQVKKMRSVVRGVDPNFSITRIRPTDYGLLIEHMENS